MKLFTKSCLENLLDHLVKDIVASIIEVPYKSNSHKSFESILVRSNPGTSAS